MFCTSCGKKLSDDAKKCSFCNATILQYDDADKKIYYVSAKKYDITILLCLLGLVGIGGLHYFYVGKPIRGLFYFFTYGGFIIGTLYDAYDIWAGGFRDGNNRLILSDDLMKPYYKRLQINVTPRMIIMPIVFLLIILILASTVIMFFVVPHLDLENTLKKPNIAPIQEQLEEVYENKVAPEVPQIVAKLPKDVVEQAEKLPLDKLPIKNLSSSKHYDVGLTESQFRTNYNDIIRTEFPDSNLILRRQSVYVDDNACVYETNFSGSSVVVSFYPESELVKGAVVSVSDGGEQGAINALASFVSIISTLNPELSNDEKGQLLKEMGLFSDGHTDYRHINKTAQRKNIKYQVQGVENGVFFYAVAQNISTEPNNNRQEPHNMLVDVVKYAMFATQQAQPNDAAQSYDDTYNQANQKLNSERDAEWTLIDFHNKITERNFSTAYNYFSPNMQRKISYEGWRQGYETTISSNIYDINIVSSSSSRIVLDYNLTAIDRPYKVQHFQGTATLINVDGAWKIDDLINRPQRLLQ